MVALVRNCLTHPAADAVVRDGVTSERLGQPLASAPRADVERLVLPALHAVLAPAQPS